jgi:hypothetical protein
VCLGAIPHATSLGVLTGDVDGVDDGVGQDGVASDGLVIHEPNVDDATVGLDGVVGVFCVVLKHEVSSLWWCHL